MNDDRWYECSTARHPVPQDHGIDHGTTITETTSLQTGWSASYTQHDPLKALPVSPTTGSFDSFSQPQPESQSFPPGRSEQPTAVRSSVDSAQYRQRQYFAIPSVPCDVGEIHDEEEQKGDRGDDTEDTEDTEEDIVCYGLLHNLDHMQLDFNPSADQELLWDSRACCIFTRDQAVRPTQRVATILASWSEQAGTTFDLKLDYSQDESRMYKPRQSKDESNTTTYALSVVLYGPRSALDVVGDWLDYIGLYLQTPSYCTKDVPYCNPHRMTQPSARVIMTSQLSGSLEQTRLDSYDSASTDLSEIYTTRIYKHAPQPERLRTILYDHQRQALSFMQGRERGWDLQDERGTNDLWQCKQDYLGHECFVDILSGQRSSQRPPDFRGGILADDMGLSKTCSMLSLIATDDHCSDFGDTTEVTVPDATPRTTLIVMPLPLLQMWEKQIKLHLVPGKTRSTTYYGQSRHLIDSFAAYDIVITTYDTVAGEWKAVQARSENKSRSPLLTTSWHRVVLDEAHTIKNRNTTISKAVSALNGERRWCITGTPIQNRSSDLYSLLRFLKLCPYDNLRNFERLFVEPWKDSLASAGLHNLQSLFRAIAIRRPKATIALTSRHEVTQKVQFSAEENHIYERTKKGVVDIINTAVAQSHTDRGRSYFNTLQRINELRYICNHGTFPAKKISDPEISTAGRVKRSIQAQADVLLGAGDIETCEVCGNELLEEQESAENLPWAGDTPSSITEARLCPTCDVRSLSPFASASVTSESSTSIPGSSMHLSSKVKSLVHSIQQVPLREKCVVFSYWTSSLELVGRALSSASITFTRYFGSMPRKKRDNDSTNSPTTSILG